MTAAPSTGGPDPAARPAPQPSAPDVPALAIHGLVKRFGAKAAVDGIDLAVPRGAFYGIVGANGAGKTTTLRMVSGLLRPDRGTVAVAGADVWRDPAEAKARIGVLPDGLPTFERLTGRDLLTFTGLLRRLPRDLVAARTEQLLEVTGLAEAADRRVEDYSHGMRKKVGLAAALLHRPALLVLDEPFEGVDPLSSRVLRGILDEYRRGGGTVVLSSHVVEVVERLCDHVAIMAAGRVLADGPAGEVLGDGTLEDVFVRHVGAPAEETEIREQLSWLGSS
ncbi:ABC transporter ATP-binding protein [Patulibacter sp. SYSU D01012]|uniref:ABC transporter ATP-binding protein n=1 Tax=Patulibacter sp. SYSU D01012 TaxID=2817381 RepID=UPI001B316C2A|nr:ABC transporter ATP-binding protein [Patulibacter sp. SYSU D01012]